MLVTSIHETNSFDQRDFSGKYICIYIKKTQKPPKRSTATVEIYGKHKYNQVDLKQHKN